MPKYYPIMLDIRGRRAVVIGGDRIAAEKATNLQASGAQVTVIHPEFCDELLVMGQHGRVTLCYKTYEPDDLRGAFVVVAATSNRQLIESIWHETQAHGQLVNIVDVPSHCTYIVPSILRRGQLTIAVSTEGASPSLARRIRQRLEGLFPSAYDTYMQLATVARTHLRKNGRSYSERDEFFGEFFTAGILELLAEGDETTALAQTAALLQRHKVDVSTEILTLDLREAVAGYGDQT